MAEQPSSPTDLATALAQHARRRSLWRRPLTLLVSVIILLTLALTLSRQQSADPALSFETAPVTRGTLQVTVTATGTLEPTNQVDVGSELSGIIEQVLVDDNDRVQVGQELARLDTSRLQARRRQATASLAVAEATLQQRQASLNEAELSYRRLQRLQRDSAGLLPARQDLENAEASLLRARAEQASAQAGIEQARASLDEIQTDLTKSVILSPINGVVLQRSVEPGQTVAASLQAPVLFTLAEDLREMELRIDIDEADVGQVQAGQSARFSVDAYPQRVFPARIERVRYGADNAEGVVTYKAVLTVDNSALLLRPGMTATAEVIVAQAEDVLTVPNAALRFQPPQPDSASNNKRGSLIGSLMPRPPRTGQKKAADPADGETNRIWQLQEGRPAALPVRPGLSDGQRTEIRDSSLREGQAVLVGVRQQP
ncbi:MAG: efflux RND transporter periplasmic adaptor subunit [Desulfuromonas thiophila]|nr:efflux RND transporter periplasmic adaptor subunit [Desulfuromonas thiophila]